MRITVLAVNNLVCVEMMQHGTFPSWTQSGLGETLLEMQAGHNSWKQGCWEMPGAPHLLQTHSGRWTVALLCCDNPVPFSLNTPVIPMSTPVAMSPSYSICPACTTHQCLWLTPVLWCTHLWEGEKISAKTPRRVFRKQIFYSLCKLHLQLEHTRLFVRGILLLEIMSQFSAKCKSAGCL